MVRRKILWDIRESCFGKSYVVEAYIGFDRDMGPDYIQAVKRRWYESMDRAIRRAKFKIIESMRANRALRRELRRYRAKIND